MGKFKSNKMFFILMGVLCIALIGTAVYWWMERGKTRDAERKIDAKKTQLQQLYLSDPTEEHVAILQGVFDEASTTYASIRQTVSSWKDYGSESLGLNDIFAIIRDEVGYGEIKQSMIRNWIDNKKLKAFEAPDGQYYVYRKDFDQFLEDAKRATPSEDLPQELITRLIESTRVLRITETPTLFLGTLQTLQREIVEYAKIRDVVLKKGAESLSFPQYLERGTPPDPEDDLIPMIKQRSAARDIMYLLIESGVFEISSIVVPQVEESGGARSEFYTTKEFEVQFVATYPAVARFLLMVLDPMKTIPRRSKVRDRLPVNMFVVKDVAYKSDEAEKERELEEQYKAMVKREEDAKRAAESGTDTTRRTTAAVGGAAYNPYAARGGTYNPYATGYYGPGGPIVSPGSSSRKSELEDYRRKKTMRDQITKDLPGRRPKHNILRVTMKVALVDLKGEITGEASASRAPGAGMYGPQ